MFCRLCLNYCKDFKFLYNANGDKDEDVYKITVKYFESLVSEAEIGNFSKYPQVICTLCWDLMNEFYKFQQNVLEAQSQCGRFEEVIKVELDDGVGPMDLLDVPLKDCTDDPVGVSGENIDLNIPMTFKDSDIDNEINSNEDEPLLERIQQKKVNQRKKAKTKPRKAVKRKSSRINCKSKEKTKEKNDIEEPEKTEKAQTFKKVEQDALIAEYLKGKLQCVLCNETCENFSAIRLHFRNIHNNNKGYVVCCESKYFHRLHLAEHIQVHQNPELFKCPHCDRCSPNRRSFQNHIKFMHSTKVLERCYECKVCHKRFAKKGILRGHMDIHATGNKNHVCSHCGKGFVLEHRLNIHIRNTHEAEVIVCEQCGKSIRGRYNLKQHLMEHAGVKKKTWPCDKCSSALRSKHSLERHKRIAHHDGSTVYVCSECGKVSLTEDALRSHKKYMHQKERKYKCNICFKAFKVALVLKEHMTTHTGEDLYQCPHCPKKFKVSANMHHHRKRVHPKEWEKTHRIRSLASHTDLSSASNEIVL